MAEQEHEEHTKGGVYSVKGKEYTRDIGGSPPGSRRMARMASRWSRTGTA